MSLIDKIKQILDGRIGDVMDALGVKRKGRSFHCWAHGIDKTASGWISKSGNYFYCNTAGCPNVKNEQRGLDVFNLVQSVLGVDFVGSEKWLADFCNLPYEKGSFHSNNNSGAKKEPVKEKETVKGIEVSNKEDGLTVEKIIERPAAERNVLGKVTYPGDEIGDAEAQIIRSKVLMDFYLLCENISRADSKYLKYWEGRGISEDTLNAFRVKVMVKKKEILSYLKSAYKEEELSVSSIFKRKDNGELAFLYHSHPMIFPMFKGRALVKVQGRDIIDRKPKFMTGTGYIPCLYNYDAIAKHKDLYCCEGIPDVMSMYELGKKNVVGVFGVINFKDEWMGELKEKHMKVLFDNDPAGWNACETLMGRLEDHGVSDEKSSVPDQYNDVNDFLKYKKLKKVTVNDKRDLYLKLVNLKKELVKMDARFDTWIKHSGGITQGWMDSVYAVTGTNNQGFQIIEGFNDVKEVDEKLKKQKGKEKVFGVFDIKKMQAVKYKEKEGVCAA